MTPHQHSPRRFKKGLFLFCFVCAAAVIFHKPLVLFGCKLALQKMIPSREGRAISYEKMQWENGAIVLSGLLLKDPGLELTVDRIELKLSGDVFRLYFAPEITVSHPQIVLSSSTSTQIPPLPFLYRTHYFQPHWTVKNGALQLSPSSRFYFCMAPGWEQESLGTLTVSHDPDPLVTPFFAAKMGTRDQKLKVGFKLQESDLQTLPSLIGLFCTDIPSGWESASGEVDVEGLVLLGIGLDIEEIHVQGIGRAIALPGSEMQLRCEEIEGSFTIPTVEAEGLFWDRISASVAFKNAECFWGNHGIKNLNGQIALESQKEPQLALDGTYWQGSQEFAFNLSGKGGVLQSPAFQGKWGPFEAEIAILDFRGGDHIADVAIQGDARELLPLLGLPPTELPLSLQIAVKREGEDVVLEGEGFISGEPIQGSVAFDGQFPALHLKEGVLSAHLTPKNYAEFIPLALPETTLFGDLQCEALFSSSSIQLNIAGEKLQVLHPLAELQVPQMKEQAAQFFYDVASKQWRGEIPIVGARLYCHDLDLAFENIEGNLQWEKGYLKAPSLYAECEGMAWCGNWELGEDLCFRVEKAEGIGELLTVRIERFSTQLSETSIAEFDLRIVDQDKELVRLEGNAVPSPSSLWNLTFDPQSTHIWGAPLHISRCTFDRKAKMTSFEMQPILKSGNLSLKGDVMITAEGFSFPHIEGVWEGISMRGSGNVNMEKERIFGTLTSLDAEFLQSPMPLKFGSREPLTFTYDNDNGFVCGQLHFQLKHKLNGAHLGDLEAETLLQSPTGELSVEQIQFSVAPALLRCATDAGIISSSLQALQWEGNLEGSGDVQTIDSKVVFLGNLNPGDYGFDGKSMLFEKLQVRYQKDLLSMRAKTYIEEQPMWASFQVDLSHEPFGMLKLFDHPQVEGLKILFTTRDAHVVWESIQGSCYGLTCSLQKSAQRKIPFSTVLTGEIAIDGNALCELLPKEIRDDVQHFQLGSGYEWQGDIVLWQDTKKGFLAQGALRGKEFEALGYRFHQLLGAVEANPTHVIFSNLQLEDPAGTIAIDKIELKKRERWDLAIPQIQVFRLHPSVMRKVDGEKRTEKPFLIQSLVLADIRGHLGDKSSLEGSGHLKFVNAYKKDSSLLDVPLDMIKSIGIDFNLLTPVQGELQMELHGDKFYLISLDNTFSEGGRSEFYLPLGKDLSYIDLDGRMHIDLKMRQDVLLKITESFTLTIRGTLDKPRYGLQY